MPPSLWLRIVGLWLLATSSPAAERGLVALYDFGEGQGAWVRDQSGREPALDLRIRDPDRVQWLDGLLEVQAPTLIRTESKAARLSEAVRRSRAITVEAWIRPGDLQQEGPARIVTLSKNASERLFTLGQEKQKIDARFRTKDRSKNGTPSLQSGAVLRENRLVHVVFVRHRDGWARVFVNGESKGREPLKGDLDDWEQPQVLALANEVTGSRPWLGQYHRLAVFSRAMSTAEVVQRHRAGFGGVKPAKEERPDLFADSVAPILAIHCLECHDPATREGRLDLSAREKAFDDPEMIVAGHPDRSLLWQVIESDEMPEDRDPLTVKEKEVLKQWISEGADWTVARIDPAHYQRPKAPEQWVRRLTRDEYATTIRAAFGVDVSEAAAELLPPDVRADGFSNTAYNLTVDFTHVDAYARLAEQVVEKMDVAAFAKRFSSKRNVNDKDMIALIEEMGRWVLRGPLDEEEVAIYRGITTTAVSAQLDFDAAVGLALEAMLQSPRFLYRVEGERGDGSLWPVEDLELASRLSYFIWGAPPDPELYEAAEDGELGQDGMLARQVERMLEDPRAVEQSVRWLGEWLDLDRLEVLNPSPELFPEWDPVLAIDMRQETELFFRDLVWRQQRPLADLFTAQFTVVTPRLAEHYRMKGVEGEPSEPVRVSLNQDPARGGLLTQGSVLTIGGSEASMVTRGLFVFRDLLRGTVRNPPPTLDVTPVPTEAGLSHRDVAEDRVANVNCGSCHGKFEPLAYGLEKFDGLGSFLEVDHHGNTLREDGEILIPGEAGATGYASIEEMMELLGGSSRLAESLTWKLAQYAVGRPLTTADVPVLEGIHRQAMQSGGRYTDVVRAIAVSDLVRRVQTVSTD